MNWCSGIVTFRFETTKAKHCCLNVVAAAYLDSLEPQAMASRDEAPLSPTSIPVEVEQFEIGSPTTPVTEEEPPAEGNATSSGVAGVAEGSVSGIAAMLPQAASPAGATSPPGIPVIAAAPPTAEPGQAPRLDPWAESRAAAATASVAATLSEANFLRMMDFWQEVSKRQEKRIDDLMQELKEIKKKDDKDPDDRGKPKDLRMPTIDVKDVKKPEEYDGDEKNFPIWYQRFRGLLINRHSSWMDVFTTVEAFQNEAIENGDGKHEKFKEKLKTLENELKVPKDSLTAEDPDMFA